MGYLHSYRYFFVLILLSNFFYGQNKNQNQSEVDFLVNQINAIQLSGKSDQVLEVSQKLLRLSNNLKNEKGLSYANYYLAQYYYDHAKFKQSIDYAKKAQKYSPYLEKDKTHSANISSLLGGNYLLLELYSLSFENYRKALKILETKKNKTSTDSLTQSSVYSHLSYIYENVNKPDSMYYFLQKKKTS